MSDEFPLHAIERPDEPSRRRFLELIGASMALAGVTGCVKDPVEKILPYTIRPPDVTPGVSTHYATTMTLRGYGTGLIVESREGRPIKIEGNPLHPASLGATGVFEQASILDLYDPYRARYVAHQGRARAWEELAAVLAAPRNDAGSGLRILLEKTASPLIGVLLNRVLERFPAAKITFYEPIKTSGSADGALMAYGRSLQTHYDLSRASVIVSLGADFLGAMPMHLRHSRHFAAQRRPSWPNPTMNRLYVVESKMTSTGSLADHRVRRRPSEIGRFAAALAAEVFMGAGEPGAMTTPDTLAALRPFLGQEERRVIISMAHDLRRAGPHGVVIAGDEQPAPVHAMAALMNFGLMNSGTSTYTTLPVILDLGSSQQMYSTLVSEMQNGQVDTLVILDCNSVYSSPSDLPFAGALAHVPRRIYLGMHRDETAELVDWFAPALHYLESWGDARAFDGTASIVQPLIRPIFGGHSSAEILAALSGNTVPNVFELLREVWRKKLEGQDFDTFWDMALRSGVIAGTESPRVEAAIKTGAGAAAISTLTSEKPISSETYEVSFYDDLCVFDGRFAGNPWLQELPEPTTKLTWGNAALLSTQTAKKLGIENGDLIELSTPVRVPPEPSYLISLEPQASVELPALVMPGHADGAISLIFGYGRTAGGPIAEDVGTNVAPLSVHGAHYRPGLIVQRKEGHVELAITQKHWELHGRPIALSSTIGEYQKNPGFTDAHRGKVLTLLPPIENTGEKWAMTIDSSICSGCSACVIACQAENNIPVVGREEVLRSREMHWIRIDTYTVGNSEGASLIHQPMLCQHCEKAPCEYVCPVNATVHSPDGLNEMVYNRCIGTRFCSNNCPYKVRRFNYFDWLEERPTLNGDVRRLQKNPNVTVRERGVMEKCTFCVQRIRRSEIQASIESRSIRPGEVVPACAAACPTQAIQFGSLMHRETPMVVWRNEPRSYSVLNDLGTVPRVQYLAMIRNPNPEIE